MAKPEFLYFPRQEFSQYDWDRFCAACGAAPGITALLKVPRNAPIIAQISRGWPSDTWEQIMEHGTGFEPKVERDSAAENKRLRQALEQIVELLGHRSSGPIAESGALTVAQKALKEVACG